MKLHDAIRKLRLLANVKESRGYTSAEARAASEMTRRLQDEFELRDHQTYSFRHEPRFSWDSWELLLEEFGLRLRKFGKRGSIAIADRRHIVSIRVDSQEWVAQKISLSERTTDAKGVGPDSLRQYLKSTVVREYAFFSRRAQTSSGL